MSLSGGINSTHVFLRVDVCALTRSDIPFPFPSCRVQGLGKLPLSVAIRSQCLADPMWQGLERLGWNVPVIYIEARRNRRVLTWEIQSIKKRGFHVRYIEIYWLWPPLSGEHDANLEGQTPGRLVMMTLKKLRKRFTVKLGSGGSGRAASRRCLCARAITKATKMGSL